MCVHATITKTDSSQRVHFTTSLQTLNYWLTSSAVKNKMVRGDWSMFFWVSNIRNLQVSHDNKTIHWTEALHHSLSIDSYKMSFCFTTTIMQHLSVLQTICHEVLSYWKVGTWSLMCATKSLVHAVYTKPATKSLVHAAYTKSATKGLVHAVYTKSATKSLVHAVYTKSATKSLVHAVYTKSATLHKVCN